ncbi:hypothetical protein ACIGFK_01955 [Streptomyces sp. NPDC085524]|uniref:hypothetical protein n=1 Tax=Streptomyces sp. NPDC085524 TaxID=3365728 RepID=UPI0037D2F227
MDGISSGVLGYAGPSELGFDAHVLYQVIEAYTRVHRPERLWEIRPLRPLAGLGTVSDVMAVLYENRRLVADAIVLKTFAQVGKIRDVDDRDEGSFGFYVAPAMNSPRRTGSALEPCFGVFTAGLPANRMVGINDHPVVVANRPTGPPAHRPTGPPAHRPAGPPAPTISTVVPAGCRGGSTSPPAWSSTTVSAPSDTGKPASFASQLGTLRFTATLQPNTFRGDTRVHAVINEQITTGA